MNKTMMTKAEFNSIPTFFHQGKECIDIDGHIYVKSAIFKLLLLTGIITA